MKWYIKIHCEDYIDQSHNECVYCVCVCVCVCVCARARAYIYCMLSLHYTGFVSGYNEQSVKNFEQLS